MFIKDVRCVFILLLQYFMGSRTFIRMLFVCRNRRVFLIDHYHIDRVINQQAADLYANYQDESLFHLLNIFILLFRYFLYLCTACIFAFLDKCI